MKNRKTINAKALTVALAALSCGAALAQQSMTNTLPTTYVYPVSAANTNQPGFTWNFSQVFSSEPNALAWAEGQLAGEEGANVADPTQIYSSASAAGTVPSDPTLPVSFIIPGVINFSIAGPGDMTHGRGDLPPEDGMVGAPGQEGTDNLAAEALTFLDLPAGLTTMGVRSDDGFQLQIGAANPGDRYSTNAVVLESFNGGRGYADSIVTFNVAEAGLYAARLLYEQGGGDASVEWYTFPTNGNNSIIGGPNTGTNAVLINDVANGGIPAYRSVTVPTASYLASLTPTPGATGVALKPTITAQIINGVTPVTDVTLSVDGAAVTPTVTATVNGVVVSYTASSPLANIPSHTLVITWNDNGTTLGVTSSFSAFGFVLLNASQVVTPDTNSPGFVFNIFANASDTLISSANGVQGGESDLLDNIELGLNGLVPDGNGGILPNLVTLANNGAAVGAAPALGGPNAPAKFVITNTLNLTGANIPGFPAQDGAADPSHMEVLTYVNLPEGLTTFNLNIDGYYRVFGGSWDYLSGVQIANIPVNKAASGSTSFSVFAPVAGYYPIRLTAFNLDGTPTLALSTQQGTNSVLVNDLANGGLAAYYKLATPSTPYVRYASPRPVPRQMLYSYPRVLLRLQDADTKLSDSSVVVNIDGKNVTTTNNRVGDVLEMAWYPQTLQTPAEIHSGALSYQDTASHSLSNSWSFMSLKAVWLPTAVPGYWVPTNAVAVENFSEYTDPTEFTNFPFATATWYTSPQTSPAANPLVDIAPNLTGVPGASANWQVWNWDAADDGTWDPTDPNSGAYANWLCVDLTTFSGIEGDSVNTDAGELINGQPLQALIMDPSQNVFIAESDNRSGSTVQGQTQFAMSKSFDLTGVTNPVIAWANIKKQNQDDLAVFEYSVDGGVTWAPIFISLDGNSFGDGGDGPDIHIAADGSVDVISSLFHDTSPGEIPVWQDSTGDVNNTYASGLGSPITPALGPFMVGRINDDHYNGKRIEVVRLPLAANKSDVRLRLGQLGTCSWYFGVANIAFYDVPLSGATVPTGLPPAVTPPAPKLSVSKSGGNVTVTWTGSGVLEWASSLTGKSSDWTAVTPAPSGNTYTTTTASGAVFFRVVGFAAPAALTSLTCTIENGNGPFATSGEFSITTSGGNYNIAPISGPVGASHGTYTYSVSGNVGTAALSDSTDGPGTAVFAFTSPTSGTYTFTFAAAPGASQTGTFVIP
jgi:hypothetical protein